MANTVHPSKRIDKEIEITKQRNERDSAIKKMNEERKKKKCINLYWEVRLKTATCSRMPFEWFYLTWH